MRQVSFPRLLMLSVLLAPWTELRSQCDPSEILATETAAGDLLGMTLAIEGDTAVIGGRNNSVSGFQAGAVYIFRRTPSGWVETQTLRPNDPQPRAYFGWGIELEGDRLFVGAPGFDTRRGKVYVFERTDSEWMETAQLIPSVRGVDDFFGLDMSTSGDEVLIGSREGDAGVRNSGAAFLFRNDFGGWRETHMFGADTPLANGRFGHSVSLDGDNALIGAFGSEGFRGRAYIFQRTGTVWQQVINLSAPSRDPDDRFGIDVAIEQDLAVISCRRDDERGTDVGSVFLYERQAGTWTFSQQIFPSSPVGGEEFGARVFLRGDRLLIGAFAGLGPSHGEAYLFERQASGWQEKTVYTDPTSQPDDHFGSDVSLSEDSALVGAFLAEDRGVDSGVAWLFPMTDVVLAATPEVARAGDTVELAACGGPPGQDVLLAIVDVDGFPSFFPIVGGEAFDGSGQWRFETPVGPGLGVLSVSFQLLYRGAPGGLGSSNSCEIRLR